ncbi:MAG TPA: hypothetical protein VHS32_10595 [Streptosporangiaceae bacterium]|jgi:hypothetical protein|nr:hypothetical protein [Streptosporangiaceae bacterium]
MTGIDLIVLAPWIVFVAGLAVICILLLRSRHASGSGRASGSRRAPGSRPQPQQPPRSARGGPAGREPARRPDPQETECRENNAEARPQ